MKQLVRPSVWPSIFESVSAASGFYGKAKLLLSPGQRAISPAWMESYQDYTQAFALQLQGARS